MITYSLICENAHKFDAWFRNAEAYDDQHKRGIVACPMCNSRQVEKALMAPAVRLGADKGERPVAPRTDKVAVASGHPDQAKWLDMMRTLRAKMVAEADDVGDKFAEEARKIHYKEAEARGIYGEATREEVAGLVEEGIDFLPLPSVPEEHN